MSALNTPLRRRSPYPGDLYVVFDGHPDHENPRFVELDDAEGKSVGGVADWKQRDDGYWTLGPFRTVKDVA